MPFQHKITPFWGCSVLQSDFMADPSACGWVLKEGRYDIVWYEGDQLPKDIVANINAIPPEIDAGDGTQIVECESDESDCDSDVDMREQENK